MDTVRGALAAGSPGGTGVGAPWDAAVGAAGIDQIRGPGLAGSSPARQVNRAPVGIRLRQRTLRAMAAAVAAGALALAGCGSGEETPRGAPAAEDPAVEAPEGSDEGGEEPTEEPTEAEDPTEEERTDAGDADATAAPEDETAPKGDARGDASDDGAETSDDDASAAEAPEDDGSTDASNSAEGSDFFAPGAPVNPEDFAFERDGGTVYAFTVEGSDFQCAITDTDPLDEGAQTLVGCHGTFPTHLTVPDPETDDEDASEVTANTVLMKGTGTEEPTLQLAGDPWLVPVTEDGSSFAEVKELTVGESIEAHGISCGVVGEAALACYSAEQSFILTSESLEFHQNPRGG